MDASARRRLALIGAAAALGALCIAIGVSIGVILARDGGDDDGEPQARATLTSVPRTPVVTATPLSTAVTPEAAPSPRPPQVVTVVVQVPAPTATPSRRPGAIQVRNVTPPIGTLSTEASFTVSVDVDYQAGDASNVLAWTLEYCFASTDCNTYSLPDAYAIVPGASGSATLSALFSPGANGLRPVALCRMTVIIGHFLTPEAKWESPRAPDSRCYDVFAQAPVVTVLDAQPAFGAILRQGENVTVNVQYDPGPANTLRVTYIAGDNCWGGLEGSKTVSIERGTPGVTTVLIPVAPGTVGQPLFHVKAALFNDADLLREYGFGPC
jgi:hypothetical protein